MSRLDILKVGPTALVTEECCACGVTFALPESLRDNLYAKRRGATFYCPNGHGQSYTGKPDAEKLAEAERRNLSLRQQLDQVEADAARKGKQLASLRKRVKNGVCPRCRRHFMNVQRHISNKHPDFAASQSGEKAT